MVFNQNLIVVVKHNGHILREQENTVYLPFGSDYSLLFKNKDHRRCSVSINIDGQDVLNGRTLILNSNSEEEIHGFLKDLNTVNKFKFIQKTKEIQDFRGDKIDDGIICIQYQYENLAYYNYYNVTSGPYIWSSNKTGINSIPAVYTTSSSDVSRHFQNVPVGTKETGMDADLLDGHHSSLYVSNSSSLPLQNEGITVKGEEHSQKFNTSNFINLDLTVYTITLQLKGQTDKSNITKPITVKTKIQCNICGRKNKSKNKFCYNCGTYLL